MPNCCPTGFEVRRCLPCLPQGIQEVLGQVQAQGQDDENEEDEGQGHDAAGPAQQGQQAGAGAGADPLGQLLGPHLMPHVVHQHALAPNVHVVQVCREGSWLRRWAVTGKYGAAFAAGGPGFAGRRCTGALARMHALTACNPLQQQCLSHAATVNSLQQILMPSALAAVCRWNLMCPLPS
jgi:hypothetical protein